MAYVGDVYHDVKHGPHIYEAHSLVWDKDKRAGNYNIVCPEEIQSAVESCVSIN